MYINPFLAGILSTLFAELVVFVICVIVMGTLKR